MDNRKSDQYYIEKVVDNIDAIISYINGRTYDEFLENEVLIDAVMFRLVQMAENLNKVSNDFKTKHHDIQWGLISGFRNGIVHDYGKTDYRVVYEIVSADIYLLRDKVMEIID